MANPLADLLLGAGRARPDAPFLSTRRGESSTYGDLERRSAQFAHALVARGVHPADRVVVQTERSPEVIAFHLAVIRAGAVYVPLNTAYTDAETAGLVADAEPALVVRAAPVDGHACVTLDDLAAAADEAPVEFADVDRDPSDPASMLYTSGTTGTPKGAVLSHRALVFNATTLAAAWEFTADDVLVHALPLYHTHGLLVAVHCTLTAGASIVMLDRFEPAAVVGALGEATVLMGVPTFYTRLLAEPSFDQASVRRMRLFISGSAPLLAATHAEFFGRTGQSVLERYGMTETCILTSNPVHGERKAGTVGRALPGVELRIADADTDTGVGSIEVRGPNLLTEYWRRVDPAVGADGWFVTGDLGRIDDDGYVELVGRSNDLVISGGLNVYPKEVEQVLDELPGVDESAVVGVPDADLGEVVVAAVVASAGAVIDPEQTRAELRSRLAGFKVPKRIHLVDELPRNPMGKVEKHRLRATLSS